MKTTLSGSTRFATIVVSVAMVLGCNSGAEDTPDGVESPDVEQPDVSTDVDAAMDTDDGEPDRWPPYGIAYDPFAEGIDVPACATYGGFGSYRVGVRSIELGGEVAEVWYPVDRAFDDEERWDFYDMRQWLPDDMAAKIDDDNAPLFVTRAVRDEPLSVDAGSLPVVVFSHGFGAYRYQSSFLTTHLASWGYVVVSTDHPSRTLKTALNLRFGDDTSPDQIRAMIAGLEALNEDASDPFSGRLDLSRVIVSGHSAGARTSGDVLADDVFSGAILYGGGAVANVVPAGKPLFILGGDRDGIIPEANIRAFYDAIEGPARYAMIADAGHLAFSDICVIARDRGGLLAYAREFGINIPVFFDRLATDGCREDDVLPEKTWPMINHISVAFIRHLFGNDTEPVGLEPDDLAECFGELLGDRDVK
jgi:dienelactone hydrolase